jgi:CRP/FNR family transcriptional regulator, cyclic AMP receptor protein
VDIGRTYSGLAQGNSMANKRSSNLAVPLIGPAMQEHTKLPFDVMRFLTEQGFARNLSKYRTDQIVYSQGDPADSVFYIYTGKVKVTVISERGKEAVVAIREPDEFCGEGSLTGKPLRLASAVAMTPCEIVQLEKETIAGLLRHEEKFADYFLHHLLTRTARVEADLVDQLFNSSEMRLARTLLLLANYGVDVGPEPMLVEMNQEMLSKIVGTTRSRVNFFMNKFRKLGLIKYNGKIEIHKALLNYVLHDQPKIKSDAEHSSPSTRLVRGGYPDQRRQLPVRP